MMQYKAKREQLLQIKQHALLRQDSGVFSSASSSMGSVGVDASVGSDLNLQQVRFY